MGKAISCVYVPMLCSKKCDPTVPSVFKGSELFPIEVSMENQSLCSVSNIHSLLGFRDFTEI